MEKTTNEKQHANEEWLEEMEIERMLFGFKMEDLVFDEKLHEELEAFGE